MTHTIGFQTPLTLSCAHVSAIDAFVPKLSDDASFELMPAAKRHTVYNFEVEGTHTYIAGGIRVHNTSVLSLLTNEELKNIDASSLEDTDGIDGFDYVEIDSIENGLKAGSTVYKQVTIDGVEMLEIYKTYTDGDGRLVQVKITRGPDGDVPSPPVILTGAVFGEQAGQLITPYLTAAILGDDANAFASIAVNTILGTFVENIFEFAGGHIHDQIVSGGLQNNGLEAIADHTFDDILTDLGSNAVSYTSGQLTSWIMAEVYGGLAADSIGGELYVGLVNNGVDYLVDAGLHAIAVDIFGMDGNLAGELGLTTFNPEQFANILSTGNIGSLVFKAVLGRILPDIETIQGQIAAGLTTLALDTFQLLQVGLDFFNFNPVTFIIGQVVGKLLDELFDTDPQAFTNVIFNEETGQFEVGSSWSADGGDVVIGQQLAGGYVDFMNGLMAQTQSQSNNLSELSEAMNLVFGHYEEAIQNGGDRNFDSLDEAIKSRVIDTLQELELNDGDLKVRDAIDDVVEMADLLDDINFAGSYSYWKKFLGIKLNKETVYTEINEDPESTNAELVALVEGSSISAGAFKDGVLASLNGIYRDITLSDLNDTNDAERIIDRLTSRSWATNLELRVGTTKSVVIDRVGDALYFRALILQMEADGYTVDTKAELITALEDSGLTVRSDADIYSQLTYNMQIAAEYQEYLDNKGAYDAAILAAGEDSGFAQGWALTFLEAERLGFTKGYDVIGDEIDNVFITSGSADTIDGAGGDDIIKTYAGDDTIIGGSGDDLIRAGAGNDTIDAGDGDDVVDAGDGDDTVTLGAGEDILQLGGAGQTVVTDFDVSEDTIGIAMGTDMSDISVSADAGGTTVTFGNTELVLSGLSAATLDDLQQVFLGTDAADVFDFSSAAEPAEAVGLGGNDVFVGSSGDDWFSGGRGGDTYYLTLDGGIDAIADREPGSTAEGTNYDRIKFGPGIIVENIRLSVVDNQLSIGVLVNGAIQAIALVEGWNTSEGRIEIFEFDDGVELNVSDLVIDEEDYSIGGDWIIGTDGDDVIDAEEGNDVVLGFGGDDDLTGSEGDDYLKGGAGTDILFGSDGDDILAGGEGDGDVLRGGLGNDTFLFETGMGADIIDEAFFNNTTRNEYVYGTDNVYIGGPGGKGDTGGSWYEEGTGHHLDTIPIWIEGASETIHFSEDVNITDLVLTGGGAGSVTNVNSLDIDDPRRHILIETVNDSGTTGDSFLVKHLGLSRVQIFEFRNNFEMDIYEQNAFQNLGGYAGTGSDDQLLISPPTDNWVNNEHFWINGLAGNDNIQTSSGQGDVLIGGKGDDTVSGRSESVYQDTLSGAYDPSSGDRFIFASDHGNDTIERFIADIDRLVFDIKGMTIADISYEQVGADTVITYDVDDTITLIDFDVTDLNSNVFDIV